MKATLCKIKNNVRLRQALKVVLCLSILVTIFRLQFAEGVKPFENYREFSSINENTGGGWGNLSDCHFVEQEFIAEGNILSDVQLYYVSASEDKDVEISVKDSNGTSIADAIVNTSIFIENEWNNVGLNIDKLNRGEIYTLCISSEDSLEGFIYGDGEAPESYKSFSSDYSDIEGHMMMGLTQIYRYFNLAAIFELVVTTVFSLAIGLALCVSIVKFEEIYGAFCGLPKQGLSYALFFAGSIVLIYNPIDEIRTKVLTFKRVIGSALNSDLDVSRRISNFNNWFIAFGVVFVLLFMLANYYIGKAKTEEQKKVVAFLDNYMILANCSLILRCITFFNDALETTKVFCFSHNIIMLIALVAVCYVIFEVDRFIALDKFEQLVTSIICISIAFAVFLGRELENGRLVLGFATVLFIIVLAFCKVLGKVCNKRQVSQALPFITIVLSFIPLATSLYIELIHVLNQHGVFVAHPARYYKVAFIIGFIIMAAALYMFIKKDYRAADWKKIVFPAVVAGTTCLSVQIPIASVYYPDLFEGANSSILLSDFLNYGDIPIVQHYGGHMMTDVWEGILYAVINNDFSGVVSPYSGLFNVVVALLFYFVIARIWNREMGLAITLLFPFLGFISYFGLGILTCLAAMAYVRENTMKRAILLWGAVIWCALYRLDLGFAFALAVIATLLIYVIAERNMKALKELGISLMGWGVLGGAAWFVICIIKGINPINRLVEFLMINLSNQNWAYISIGTVDNMLFVWGYIIVPFAMVLALVYTVLARKFREKIGTERWVLLLILNLSYFQNFSRGLVRHSLAENHTTIVFWSAYLFFAMFLAFYKESMKWFIPTFMLLIVLNGLFLTPDIFVSYTIADDAVSAPEAIIESWKSARFCVDEDALTADDGTVFQTNWEKIAYSKEKVERVQLAQELTDYASEYENLLNVLLEDDETFVDFINKTVLYSVMGYRCPVYVSQSPLQLSGEFTQKEFIKEIEGVPVVLMPVDAENYRCSNSLDGVTNAYRYYLVYEYIYRNYKPLCRNGDKYAVWCLPEKYDEYKSKLSGLITGPESAVGYIDYGYDGPVESVDENGNACYEYIDSLHSSSIDKLPRIWAESDKQDSVNNKEVCTLSNVDGYYVFDNKAVSKSDTGNYLKLTVDYDALDTEGRYEDDDESTGAKVIFGSYQNGKFIEKYRYKITVDEGKHDYLIRCSTDYYWYLREVNAVKTETVRNLRDVTMSVLEGD